MKREKMESRLNLFQDLLEMPTSLAATTPIDGVVDLGGGTVAINDLDLQVKNRRGERREVEDDEGESEEREWRRK